MMVESLRKSLRRKSRRYSIGLRIRSLCRDSPKSNWFRKLLVAFITWMAAIARHRIDTIKERQRKMME